ncbi:MAG: hypothetical protein CL581_20045 [Alteromonadaceae bacterium]|nr:hypothetical protein [Alteromonadaceae bacterium]
MSETSILKSLVTYFYGDFCRLLDCFYLGGLPCASASLLGSTLVKGWNPRNPATKPFPTLSTMSMDAAKNINTLNQKAGLSGAPTRVDFAIVDLAIDDDLLKNIYAGMTSETIEWWSLFTDTSWQENWQHGPILVDLRHASKMQSQLIAIAAEVPIGLMITSKWQPVALRDYLAHWLCSSTEGEGKLLRFHEPRMFGPLLCALANEQSALLGNAASSWHWHDSHQWREHWPTQPADSPHETLPEVAVASNQIEAVTPYRLAADAQGYAEYYASVLSTTPEPEHWALERLIDANEAGFNNSAHQEQWLRLALRHGADFYLHPPFKALLVREDLSPTERFIAMESEPEIHHAAV